MTNIYKMIVELQNEPSTLKKVEIINKYKSVYAKHFFAYTLNDVKYGLKKTPSYTPVKESEVNFGDMLNLLDKLGSRELTGNAAIDAVSNLLNKCSEEDAYVFLCMLQKKTRCGVSSAFVNKVYPNLITIPAKVMKAQSYSAKNMKNIVYPAISQRKCDGARCLAVNPSSKDEDIFFMSSSGKTYYGLSKLAEELSRLPKDYIYDGELLVVDEHGNVLSRKLGNGILNKSLHNTISEEEASRVRLVLWDCVKVDEYENESAKTPYEETYTILSNLLKADFEMISFVEGKIVNNKEEAIEHFKEMLARGEEGTILKNLHSHWENARSKNCVKFKIVIQTTMKVTDFLEGKEKYANKLGAILCESSDGIVQVKVGSGLSDEDRELIWNNQSYYKENFIEIESNGLIIADDGTYSLFLPRFIEVREDKTEADSFDTIQALSDGSKMLI